MLLKFSKLSTGVLRSKIVKHLFLRTYNDVPFEDIPEVSSALIKKTLNSHKINYEDGFTCFITSCVACNKKVKAAAPNLYINKTTGMFMCSSCKCTGQWEVLEKMFASEKSKNKNNKQDFNVVINHMEKILESQKIIKESTELLTTCDKFESVLQKFKLPVISKAAIKNVDIRVDLLSQHLYFPLENVESEIVGYRKLNCDTGEDRVVPHIMYGGVLTGKASKNKETAVLVPNISDFLSLVNGKLTQNVVCMPNGVNNLSQYVLPALERYKKLILWFGNDIKSWDSARHFAKKLGEKRCLFIRPTEKQLLPHLVDSQEYKSIINSAQPIWHKSITNFGSLRQDVLSDLQNIDKVQGVKWKRYPALNKILKGHRRGELTVLTGPTGCGKTTFISEYSLDLAMQGQYVVG